jgi:hypothetical protein
LPDRNSNPPVETAPRDARLEAYLDRACTSLAGRLAPSERRELRAELAAHLDSLVDAYQELGSERDEAVEQALVQFGDPGLICKHWPEDRSPSTNPTAQAWRAGAAGSVLALSAFAASAALLMGDRLVAASPPVEAWLASPVVPLVAGFITGLRHGRSRRAAWTRLLLTGLAGFGVSLLLPGVPPHAAFSVAVARLCLWLVASCGTCGLGILCAAWKDRAGRGAAGTGLARR